MQDLLEQFETRRRLILPTGNKRPSRYPDELRRLAIAYTRQAIQAGERPSRIAAALNVDPATLNSWYPELVERRPKKSTSRKAGLLQRAQIVDAPVLPDRVAKGLTLVGPRGLRVEGLDFEQVIALIERLAC
jgi:hypothetical protein